MSLKIRTSGLIAIANEANRKVCEPIGQAIAAEVDGQMRVVDRVTGTGWAKTQAGMPVDDRANITKLLQALQHQGG